jgi:sigma-B regulation protein RsbU (phosphoserine phosphatase)
LEEAVTNVIEYAYAEDDGKGGGAKDKPIDVMAVVRDDELKFVITDEGKPFDPTKIADVNIDQDAGSRPVGGLGIHLYKNIMDNVIYRRLENKNILTLTKKLQ